MPPNCSMAPIRSISPWMVANTSIEFSTPQTTAVATTIPIPIAIESRNDSFITDHGSTRETANRIRRGPVSAVPEDAGRAPLAAEGPEVDPVAAVAEGAGRARLAPEGLLVDRCAPLPVPAGRDPEGAWVRGAAVVVCPVGRPEPEAPPDPAGGTLGGIDAGRSVGGRLRAEVRTGALPVCCVGSLIGSRPRLPPMLRTTVRHQPGCWHPLRPVPPLRQQLPRPRPPPRLRRQTPGFG